MCYGNESVEESRRASTVATPTATVNHVLDARQTIENAKEAAKAILESAIEDLELVG